MSAEENSIGARRRRRRRGDRDASTAASRLDCLHCTFTCDAHHHAGTPPVHSTRTVTCCIPCLHIPIWLDDRSWTLEMSVDSQKKELNAFFSFFATFDLARPVTSITDLSDGAALFEILSLV